MINRACSSAVVHIDVNALSGAITVDIICEEKRTAFRIFKDGKAYDQRKGMDSVGRLTHPLQCAALRNTGVYFNN